MAFGTPEQVEGYLRSAGYTLLNSTAGFVVADKPDFGGDRDTLLVWMPAYLYPGRRFAQFEAMLIDRIDDQTSRYPDGRCTILVESLDGITRTFREVASSRGIRIRVPVQFFDAPFRVEESADAVSAIKSLRDTSELLTLIPQPFSEDGTKHTGPDLLTHLRDEIAASDAPCVRFVVGGAGAGKSVLFQRLFALLYRDFGDAKNKLTMASRPIPLIPEYLRTTYMSRVPQLIESFLRSDVAAQVSRDTLEWMLTSSCCTWMFDGLDELYFGDPEFFDYILDLLTRPNGSAQILVCARDSLLSSNDAFVQFIRGFAGDNSIVKIYRLSDWDTQSRSAFAWAQIEQRPRRSGETNTSRVEMFLNAINSTETVRKLSGLPYYCSLLVERFLEGKPLIVTNQFQLLGDIIDAMKDREVSKGMISPEFFEADGLEDFLEAVASDFCVNNYAGTSIDDIRVYSDLILRQSLGDEVRQNQLISLIQYPLFVATDRARIVSFKHELLAEYLFGRQLAKAINLDQPRALRALDKLAARPLLKDTLSFQYLISVASEYEELRKKIEDELFKGNLPDKLFRVLLQLWIASGKGRSRPMRTDIFEDRDLSGVDFRNVDLSNVSFRGANLTDTSFVECSLASARFEDAHIIGTVFRRLDKDALVNAHFGNFLHFEYAYDGSRRIEDRGAVKEWAATRTGVHADLADPCATVFQIRGLFGKFVHEDGTPRRDDLPFQALLRGRVFDGAPTPEDGVSCCIKHSYLTQPNFRNRVRRAVGDAYDEIVTFMKDWSVSDGISKMLRELCPIRGCRHIPPNLR